MKDFVQVVNRVADATDYFIHHEVPESLWQEKFKHLLTSELKEPASLDEKMRLIELRQREVTEAFVALKTE